MVTSRLAARFAQSIAVLLIVVSLAVLLLMLGIDTDWPAWWAGLTQPDAVVSGVSLFAWLFTIAFALMLASLRSAGRAARPSGASTWRNTLTLAAAAALAMAVAGIVYDRSVRQIPTMAAVMNTFGPAWIGLVNCGLRVFVASILIRAATLNLASLREPISPNHAPRMRWAGMFACMIALFALQFSHAILWGAPRIQGKTVAQWKSDLNSRDPRVRFQAAVILGRIPDERLVALPVLLEDLGGQNTYYASDVLAQYPSTPQLFSEVMRQLRASPQPNPNLFAVAMRAAEKNDARIIELLDLVAGHSELFEKTAMQFASGGNTIAADRLLQYMAQLEPERRAALVMNLNGKVDGLHDSLRPTFLSIWRELLHHPEEDVRLRAASVLGQSFQPGRDDSAEQIREFVALLADTDPAVRASAARALGKLGRPSAEFAFPDLVRALDHPEFRQLLDECAHAIGRVKPMDAAVRELEAALAAATADQREPILQCLGRGEYQPDSTPLPVIAYIMTGFAGPPQLERFGRALELDELIRRGNCVNFLDALTALLAADNPVTRRSALRVFDNGLRWSSRQVKEYFEAAARQPVRPNQMPPFPADAQAPVLEALARLERAVDVARGR